MLLLKKLKEEKAALAPLSGVQNRLFTNWLKLRDMNTVNDLIEKGFIKAMESRMIALHPMMQEVTAENELLLSNLHANLGGMYKTNGKLELAKENMEQAIRIIDVYSLAQYHDSIVQITNYAVLLTDMGQPDVGLSALRKLCRVIREYNSDTGLDYASVQEAMGGICLTMGDVQQATTHFKKAMAIYEMVFEAEPEMIDAKKQELLGTYTQAGLYLGKKMLE